MSCHQGHCPIQQRAPIFPSLPFVTYVLTEALLVFDIPHRLQFQLGFGFPDLIPACLDNVSVFLTGYLSLLPPSLCFLFVFEFG